METDATEKIATIENVMEAHLLTPLLESEGIPHVILSYHDTAYDGLFQFQKGWGEVRAASRFRDRIRELLEDLRNASPPE